MKHNFRKVFLIGLLVLAASLACRSGARTGQGGQAADRGDGSQIEVAASEFEFTLSASQAGPGTVTFVVRNEGSMEHDFAIQGEGVEAKTPMLDPGESATLEVELVSGSYSYVCTVPGHAMLGMKGTFTVTP